MRGYIFFIRRSNVRVRVICRGGLHTRKYGTIGEEDAEDQLNRLVDLAALQFFCVLSRTTVCYLNVSSLFLSCTYLLWLKSFPLPPLGAPSDFTRSNASCQTASAKPHADPEAQQSAVIARAFCSRNGWNQSGSAHSKRTQPSYFRS